MEHPRLRPALKRVLLELNNCVLKRRAFNSLMTLETSHGLDFFRICKAALENDLYAGAHRAFDRHEDAVSFWYIENISGKLFTEAIAEAMVDRNRIEELAEKLKNIRDRVHFHADRRDLEAPSKPWQDANMSGNEFIDLTESAHEVLRILNRKLTSVDSVIPNYNGADIEKIIRAYKDEYPDAPLSI